MLRAPEGAKAPAAQETVRTVPVRRPPDAEALREAAPSQAQPVQTAPAAPTQDVTEDVPPKKPATKRSKAAAKMPPLPGRKPIASRAAAFVPEDMPREDAVPLTRDDAVRIALKAAPPARRFQARQIVHKERPVYIVTFFTDGGPHDILVDAETGDIVQP